MSKKITERVVSPEKLKTARVRLSTKEGRELSQADIAERAGISRPNYGRLEAGNELNCKIGKLSRIASALRVAIDDLLDGESAATVADPESLVV